MSTIRDKLAEWSRDELVTLVERMVHLEPDLCVLLDTSLPGRHEGVRGSDIATQVRHGFQVAARDGWRGSLALARQLGDLVDLGIMHLDSGEPSNAIQVLTAGGQLKVEVPVGDQRLCVPRLHIQHARAIPLKHAIDTGTGTAPRQSARLARIDAPMLITCLLRLTTDCAISRAIAHASTPRSRALEGGQQAYELFEDRTQPWLRKVPTHDLFGE